MTIGASQNFEKWKWERIQRFRRLVNQDFPWLWAINNSWYSTLADNVRASGSLEEFYAVLLACCDGLRPGFGVWIAKQDNELSEILGVERIFSGEEMGFCWAQRIVENTFLHVGIVYVAISDGLGNITIFRNPEKSRPLNNIIEGVARIFEATNKDVKKVNWRLVD